MNADPDRQKIRQVIEKWLEASQRGDTGALLPLMAEDVVFLLPGQESMRGRDAFVAAMQASGGQFRLVDGRPEIHEIHVSGDFAFCWNRLEISLAARADGQIHHRAGDILSVFRREPDGRWVLFRDANLLTPRKNA